eukprot:GHVS01023084.1.p1 GENE.GHVS01023084.1~~GHVS01023084.1.p1  ORF type:complete len:366 (-),score=88.52 GHVS01023084.1:5-1102(-)
MYIIIKDIIVLRLVISLFLLVSSHCSSLLRNSPQQLFLFNFPSPPRRFYQPYLSDCKYRHIRLFTNSSIIICSTSSRQQLGPKSSDWFYSSASVQQTSQTQTSSSSSSGYLLRLLLRHSSASLLSHASPQAALLVLNNSPTNIPTTTTNSPTNTTNIPTTTTNSQTTATTTTAAPTASGVYAPPIVICRATARDYNHHHHSLSAHITSSPPFTINPLLSPSAQLLSISLEFPHPLLCLHQTNPKHQINPKHQTNPKHLFSNTSPSLSSSPLLSLLSSSTASFSLFTFYHPCDICTNFITSKLPSLTSVIFARPSPCSPPQRSSSSFSLSPFSSIFSAVSDSLMQQKLTESAKRLSDAWESETTSS